MTEENSVLTENHKRMFDECLISIPLPPRVTLNTDYAVSDGKYGFIYEPKKDSGCQQFEMSLWVQLFEKYGEPYIVISSTTDPKPTRTKLAGYTDRFLCRIEKLEGARGIRSVVFDAFESELCDLLTEYAEEYDRDVEIANQAEALSDVLEKDGKAPDFINSFSVTEFLRVFKKLSHSDQLKLLDSI